jgi:hypothetical protein
MNVHILGNAMAMWKLSDQKVDNYNHAKAQCKWNKLIIVVEQCSPLSKPTLVKLASK